ncbi:MAG: right-handed parallel beta-helix repeat-containing protein [Planctomycetota bacterium]|jgi:hypothetical protein
MEGSIVCEKRLCVVSIIFLVFLRGIGWGASIDVNNPSFEDPPGGKQEGNVPTGWSVQGSDFGIEGVSCDGLQSLFLGKNNYGYQLTDHTIAAGDEYTLRFDAFKTWPASPEATYEGWLYYKQGANRIEIASVAGNDVAMDCDEYQLTYTVQPADSFIGKKLGVLFINTSTFGGGIWVGFDNVRLEVDSPLLAGNPYPTDGDENIADDVVLHWEPGSDANAHDVYLGTDLSSVSSANTGSSQYMGRVDSNSYDTNDYDPCGLEFSRPYYWRVDGVNGPDSQEGVPWEFTVRGAGDFSRNGTAGFEDLVILVDDWLNSGSDIVAEAYKDDKVDFKDYSVLMDTWHWGRYFVDSVGGNDNNSGTSPEEAWKSLSPVNSTTFIPGNKILFKAGTTYTGQLKPQGSGGPGKPIIIDMYGDGNKPRIDGEGLVLDTLLLENVEYWEVSNLEITNLGPTRENWRTGVKVFANNCGTLHQIQLKNLYVHDVNGSLDKSTEGCGIYWQCSGATPSRFDGLVIEDCNVVRTDRNGICGRSSFTDRSGNWFPSLNVVIRGNVIEDCGGDCIKPWGCEGCLVEFNVVRGGRQRCDDYAAGIWPWSCDNTVIQFNEVSQVKGTKDGQGFDSDYNCRYSLFQYNYSHDNDGGFMLVCGPAATSSMAGTIGTVIRYNISQNDAERTFHISGGGVQDTFIYNNIIYVGAGFDIPIVLYGDWEGWPDNTQYYNNIFYADGTARYAYATSRNSDGTYNYNSGLGSSTNNVFSNNVFYGNHVSPPFDPNAITADPNLVDPNSGGDGIDTLDGYMLQAGSPCISSGTNTGIDYNDPNYINGGLDFWGNELPDVNAVDVGAHQYSN